MKDYDGIIPQNKSDMTDVTVNSEAYYTRP